MNSLFQWIQFYIQKNWLHNWKCVNNKHIYIYIFLFILKINKYNDTMKKEKNERKRKREKKNYAKKWAKQIFTLE